MNAKLLCLSLALGMLSLPVRAQTALTPMHMSVREFLAASFEGAKAKYVIGSGLDGELILSVAPARLTPNQAFRIAALAVDYPIEHLIVDGIHVIRRKTGQNAEVDTKKIVARPPLVQRTPDKKARK